MGTNSSSSLMVLFLAFLSSLSLQLLLVGAEADQDNSPQWVTVCDGSYLFSEDVKNWYDAKDNCELYGSHLLQIDNMAENYCLLDYAQSQGMKVDYWYHSGNDIEREGVYRQASGPVTTMVTSSSPVPATSCAPTTSPMARTACSPSTLASTAALSPSPSPSQRSPASWSTSWPLEPTTPTPL